jgi:hypothetical protein
MRSTFNLPQQQPAAVGTELSTVKASHDLALSYRLETQLFKGTLCLFHAAASAAYQVVLDNQLNSTVRRLFHQYREKCGLTARARQR